MEKFTGDYLNAIMKSFSATGKTFRFAPINNGFINDTYLVLLEEAPKYILQRVNHNVFKDIDGLMSNIDQALQGLISDDYTKIELVPSLSKKPYHSDTNGYWRLMTFINNSTTYNTTTDLNIAFEAGRIIGRFHQLLQDADGDSYVDTIPDFHSLNLRKGQFNVALEHADAAKKKTAKDAISFARGILEKLESQNTSKLPIRICHNDTKLNNILFSEKSGEALCLIDLDTLMKGYFQYDFGDAIRTIVNTAAEDEKELGKITFQKELFDAFIDGLASNGPFLTPEERDTLHFGAIVMPFIHGLRALTDYLNNNIYYKITYENQNLDRCLSLFDFTQKALDHADYMQKVVAEKLA